MMKKYMTLIATIFTIGIGSCQFGVIGIKSGYVYFANERIGGIESMISIMKPINNKIRLRLDIGIDYSNSKGLFKYNYNGKYSIFDNNFKAPLTNPRLDKKDYLNNRYGFKIFKPKPDSYYLFKLYLGIDYKFKFSRRYIHHIKFSGIFSYHDFVQYVEAIELLVDIKEGGEKYLQYIPLYKRFDDLGLNIGYEANYILNKRSKILIYFSVDIYTSEVITLSSGIGFLIDL